VLERLRLIETKGMQKSQADTWKLPQSSNGAVITAVISGILALLSQIVAGFLGCSSATLRLIQGASAPFFYWLKGGANLGTRYRMTPSDLLGLYPDTLDPDEVSR
jgi:hypothetical protein